MAREGVMKPDMSDRARASKPLRRPRTGCFPAGRTHPEIRRDSAAGSTSSSDAASSTTTPPPILRPPTLRSSSACASSARHQA